ncbi:MAG: hypothetical protein CMG64_04555 [Candidatus Marinimicrobia bacterium]|nr:hypothetical protein [Candidatus Neomarinimicrobiota bacterium]|tara:strand:+ start:10863 stop:12134 length:1272 start_codon:yes stop_codon:yes gene_type:complete
MNKYNFNNITKIIFLISSILVASLFFYINAIISNESREQHNKQVQTLVNIYHNKINSQNIDFDYLTKEFIPLLKEFQIPMIITTKNSDGSVEYQDLEIQFSEKILKIAGIDSNFNIDNITDYEENLIKDVIPVFNKNIELMVRNMDDIYEPLTIVEIDGKSIVQIHYGDSISNNKTKFIPYIGFGFFILVLFVIIIVINIFSISQGNLIYAGMAKETAHQLGTPISSLMGWVDLLKNGNKNVDKKIIIDSMHQELSHLDKISNKFEKIGSKPSFKKINLTSIIRQVIEYFEKRIPKTKQINFIFNYNEDCFIDGDSILIYWAFENLIKNSLESIDSNQGNITVAIEKNDKTIKINFEDDGVRIPKKIRKQIFKPGFSSKNRGWGLGLSLTKRIIEYIHNGKIKLLKIKSNKKIFQIIFKNFYF